MKKALILAMTVLLLAGLLGGCYFDPSAYGTTAPSGAAASAGPTATASPVIKPEQLISKAEAETLVGSALKDGELDTNAAAGMTQCFYDSPLRAAQGKANPTQGEAYPFLQVSVTQQATIVVQNMTAKGVYDALLNSSPAPQGLIRVSDIGADAFITPPGLHIYYDGYYVSIAVGDPANAANQEILKAAGKLAVENLKKLLKK